MNSQFFGVDNTPHSDTQDLCSDHRNSVWQMDLRHSFPVIGEDGKLSLSYILLIMDDATRMIMHVEIYDTEMWEAGFIKTILTYGLPDSILVDHSRTFRVEWFVSLCAALGIQRITANNKKAENFWLSCISFLQKLSHEPPMELVEVNSKLLVWLEEVYLNQHHPALTSS